MQREIYPASSAAGGRHRNDHHRAVRGRRFVRLALAAWAVGAVLAGTALAQPSAPAGPEGAVQAPWTIPGQAQPMQPPPGQAQPLGPPPGQAQPQAQPLQPPPGQTQPQAQPLQPPPGPAPAFADDPRQGEQWLASYQGCIERHVAALAAQGGDVRQVAETAYGACQHIAAMAGAPVERREALQQAAWSYALQAALRRLEGEGGLAP